MDELITHIYHEEQADGSMLCAQHSLNSLLQGNYFTSADLAEIGDSLDQLERMHREDDARMRRNPRSRNMDDTGFFSVQVLEDALKVWGLTLIRWRSEVMRPYINDPELQPGFILNLEQHWFTMRRFGSTEGNFHWFNLDSGFKAPQYVSSTYLGMVLQQAESEGYSVFVVRPVDNPPPDTDLANPLPACDADIVAASVPPPDPVTRGQSGLVAEHHDAIIGLDDEDMELQRALQLSMMDTGPAASSAPVPDPTPAPLPPPVRANPPSRSATSSRRAAESLPPTGMFTEPIAEFEASMARQRAHLSRAMAEQLMALQEAAPDDGPGVERPRRARGEEEEEEEAFRKAMAESLASVVGAGGQGGGNPSEEGMMGIIGANLPSTSTPPTFTPPVAAPAAPSRTAPPRVYDDEDAELQAALRASLEDVPTGFVVPDTPPRRSQPISRDEAPRTAVREVPRATETNAMEVDDDEEEEEEDFHDASPPKVAEPTAEEMRRKRLARFGG